jgi:hypothetical protein
MSFCSMLNLDAEQNAFELNFWSFFLTLYVLLTYVTKRLQILKYYSFRQIFFEAKNK